MHSSPTHDHDDDHDELELVGAGFWAVLVAINQIDTRLARIEKQLTQLHRDEKIIMADLTDLTAQVAANTDAEQSAIALLNELSALITAAGTDPAALAALADQLRTNAADLGAAIVANTPVAP